MAKDYYAILGVERDVGEAQLKRAYKEAALRYHPDRNPGDPEAEERFKEVTEAYQILSDPRRRQHYDAFGTDDPRGVDPGFVQLDMDDVMDIFQSVFGFGGGGARRRRRRKGADVRLGVTIPFEESYLGGRREVSYRSLATCDACGGVGARAGSDYRPCPSCGGQGEVLYNQGFLQVKRLCSRCRGRGRVPAAPCPECGGSGGREKERTLELEIPPGVMDGAMVRVPGRGEPSRGEGSPGDLVVVYRVEPDPEFTREGAHLVTEMEVPFYRAALGGELDVTLPGGRVVTVKIKGGTQHGAIIKARGWGFNTGGGHHGDLLVRLNVTIPRELSEEQKTLLELFASEAGGGDPTLWDRVRDALKG
jgi:molecular chaperone DnaJ